MEAVNNRATLLMDNIKPLITPLFGQHIQTDKVERVTTGIITKWSEGIIYRDMLTTVTSMKYPTSRARPIYTFRNFRKVYDIKHKKTGRGFNELLAKFSHRLPKYRSNIYFLNEHRTNDNIVVGFLRTAAVCLLFHNTETNNDLYRYGIESHISCDYHKEDQYQLQVFKTNSADLRPPDIIEIAAPQINEDMVDLTTPAQPHGSFKKKRQHQDHHYNY